MERVKEINPKFLKSCDMLSLEDSLKVHGDSLVTRYTFYSTFLIQSDKKVLQYLRECSLDIETTLTYDEYIELEHCRQYAVEQVRELEEEMKNGNNQSQN